MDFDFITDERFRASLTNDFKEMHACEKEGSWKAALVLAGSIIEALLIEYLVVSGLCPNGRDPLTLDLNGAIQACEAAGVVKKTTSSLCDAIRDYRNLIHPGRAIRLQHEVTEEGAIIAVNLVSLITKEIAQKRKTAYGPTAEQLAKKLKFDEHSLALLPQLLSETNYHERTRLVVSILPNAYFAEGDFAIDDDLLSRYTKAYKEALATLTPEKQKEIAETFAKSVREDSAQSIQAFSEAFFSAEQIQHLNPSDAALVTDYLLTRVEHPKVEVTDGLINTVSGIGRFIALGEIEKFCDMLIRLVLRQPQPYLEKAVELVGRIFDETDEERQKLMEKRIGERINSPRERSPSVQQRLHSIENVWMIIPF